MWLLEFKSSFFCRCLVVFPFLLAMPLVSSTPDTGPMMTRGRWCVTVCCVVWLREGKVGVEDQSSSLLSILWNWILLLGTLRHMHWLLWEWKICDAANKKAKLLTLAIELSRLEGGAWERGYWKAALLHITSQKCVSTIVHIYHLHNTLLVLASGQWLWAAKYSPGYPGNRHGLAHHLLQGGSWGKERSGE